MTTTVRSMRKKWTGRVAAVSALGVIGAAGLSVAPVNANPNSGGQSGSNSENVSLTSSKSADGMRDTGSELKADYEQTTKYVYYENAIKASIDASQFDKSSFSMAEDAAFNRNLQNSMSSYLNAMRGGKY